jgi:hypothetical protein
MGTQNKYTFSQPLTRGLQVETPKNLIAKEKVRGPTPVLRSTMLAVK